MINNPIFQMNDAPRDGSVILAYHTLWKVAVCIKFVSDMNSWTDSTYTVKWTEEAFVGWIECPKFDI